MSEWKLKDCCLSISDGDHLPPPKTDSGIPFITISNIDSTNHIDFSNTLFVPIEYYENLDDIRKARPNDIIYSVVGSFGKPVLIKDDRKFVFQRHIAILRPNSEIVDSRFLYYVMLSRDFYMQADTVAIGAAQRTISLSSLRNMKVELPSLPIQHRIATILSRYDSLIENYQKQIKLLEEAAQRLYKEWFVELRFPGHENMKMVDGLPEGWEKKKLGELVTKSIGGGWGKESPQEKYDKEGFVIRGTDISKLRCGNLDDIPFRYHTESNLKERTLSDGDLIFEVSGGSEKEPVGRMYLITQQILDFYKKDVICASFCKKVAFSNKCTSILCYFAMQYCRISGDMKKFEKDSAGNIINFAWTSFLEDFFVLLPNDEILEAFYKTAIAIINKQVNLALQIHLLTEARDRLLPRLMGGGMEVDAPKGQRAINPVHRSGRPEGAKK